MIDMFRRRILLIYKLNHNYNDRKQLSSRIPSEYNDEEAFTLKEFENNASMILGHKTIKLIRKILKKEYRINMCETTGPKRSELKIALEKLMGAYATRVILAESKEEERY